MTQVDTSIYGNMLRPVKSVQEYDAEAQQAEGNKLGLLLQRGQYDAQQRGVADDAAYRDAVKGFGADTGANTNMLRARGLGKQAMDYEKSALEAGKTSAEVANLKKTGAKTDSDLMDASLKRYRTGLDFIETPQGAASWLKAQYEDPALSALMNSRGPFEEAIKHIPQTPAEFDQWRQRVAMGIENYSKKLQEDRKIAETANNNKAQQATAARNASTAEGQLGVSRQRLTLDQQAPKGQYDAERGVLIDPRTGEAKPVTMGGQPLAPRAKAVAATEDERKAVGWFNQADNAWKNMQAAMGGVDPKTGGFKNADVARPGIADAIAAVPSFGIGEVVGNTLRSPERQKFNQGASSLSEAILRAATGAGVNRDEALQKVRELTPVFGEDSSTTKQKMDSIPMYLNSLKQRAGRAMSQPGGNSGGASGGWGDGWSIEEVK